MDLISHLRSAKKMLIFTGAGISTNSGIPDFRGPDGVWKRRQPVMYQDFMLSETSRIEHWDFKLEGWEGFRNAQPNAVHHAVAKLEKAGKVNMVVTQNIDGLHSRAGTSPACLVEIHGTNLMVECQMCNERFAPEEHYEYFRVNRKTPLCHCGGYLKPATISFGQPLDAVQLYRAESAVLEADLVIALGSTLSVYPAARLPITAAKLGTPYIIINRGPTEHDGQRCVTLRLEGDVSDIFPAAVDEALG